MSASLALDEVLHSLGVKEDLELWTLVLHPEAEIISLQEPLPQKNCYEGLFLKQGLTIVDIVGQWDFPISENLESRKKILKYKFEVTI